MDRVWIALGPDAGPGADRPPTPAPTRPDRRSRPPPGPPADARRHAGPLGPGPPVRPRRASGRRAGVDAYRVRIEAARRVLGSIWAAAPKGPASRTGPRPGSSPAAADQIGQALAQDRLAAEAQAAEIARQSDALKSALLQSVSHDLRTPLATIRAAAGTLRPDSGLSDEDRRESADAIDREVEYLNRLVTNLLDLSRIEAGALRAETRRLRARRPRRPDARPAPAAAGRPTARGRARRPARPGRPGVPRRGRDQRARERDQVHAGRSRDPDRRPAARRGVRPPDGRGRRPGRPGRRPAAAVRQVLPGAGQAGRVAIRDRDRAGRRPGLVEAMGGRVGARRSDLGGLAIDIDLPIAAMPTHEDRERADVHRERRLGPGRAAGPTILVVEDDEETRAALARELAARGYRVEEADGRRERAARAGRAAGPDLVLLDLGLPDMDGLDIVRRIRREATTPIVILSGRVRGAREGRGARARRRRLRHQAVRRRRAERPAARRPPARGRAGRRRRPARSSAGPLRVRRRPPRGQRRRAAGRPHAARVRDPARPARPTPAGS